jgi:hypothetical protein
MKAHLPRHLLGYKQEKMGYAALLHAHFFLIGFDSVDKADTSKLGWVRGATYFDTYAPALPKKVKHFCFAGSALTSAQAILGAAGFKVEETYDPVWTRVHVPPRFLGLICPKAESIRDEIASSCYNYHSPNSLLIYFTDRANLSGAFNYWQMVIDLRPYAFQVSLEALAPQTLFDVPLVRSCNIPKMSQIRPLPASRVLRHRRSELDAIHLPFRAFIAPGERRQPSRPPSGPERSFAEGSRRFVPDREHWRCQAYEADGAL